MNILCIGDLVGKPGRRVLTELLPDIKREFNIDFTVANVENAAGGSGVTPRIANFLLRLGCDVLTMGDHVWDRPEIQEYLVANGKILRPANFPDGTPGRGWCIAETLGGAKVGVINLLGRVFMRYNVDCPFRTLAAIVGEIRRETPVIVVDMHAETTSEKNALGFFIDGKVSAVVGTHTHIQTADEKILPQGTAYITDLGMTGPYDSVIGQDKDKIIKRFITCIPARFEVAKNDAWLHGAIIDVDEKTGLARKITRLQRRLP
jgi:2',3'-cyclic-nucleotide 2'-phosphodiesterase